MKNFDRWASIVLAIVSLVVLAASSQFPKQVSRYGPGFFPTIVAIGTLICAILLCMHTQRAPQQAADEKQAVVNPRILGLFMLMTCYALFVSLIGLPVSTLLFLLVYQRCFFFRGWKFAIVLSLVSTGILWLVFLVLLNIPLKGIFLS